MKIPKIEISLTPDDDGQYSFCVLAWTDSPCLWRGLDSEQKECIMPGTENGTWYNTGLCGNENTPEAAFAKGMELYRKKSRGTDTKAHTKAHSMSNWPKELPEITPADEMRWPHCDNTRTVQCFKLIDGLDEDTLRNLMEEDEEETKHFTDLAKGYTNPSWIVGRAAETLYRRGLIDEVELDFRTR